MIDIAAIITAAAPIVTGLASLIMNIIVYFKTHKIQQAVTQQPPQTSTPPTQGK